LASKRVFLLSSPSTFKVPEYTIRRIRNVCAFCLADYFRRVFDAIRERVSYHLVLDDPSSVLRLAESSEACDAFYEAVVVRRVEAEGVYHDRVRRGCNLCAALRGEACRVEGVN